MVRGASWFGTPGEGNQAVPIGEDARFVGYVLDRLDEAGGSAVLVLLTDNALRIATLGPASAARLAVAAQEDRVSAVHEDSRVDMFFRYLERVGSVVVRRVTAQLVDHGSLQLT